MNRICWFLSAVLIAAPLADGYAKPKRADGGKCDSTGSERKDGKDQSGNTVNCKWDTCTYTKCDTSGGTISNCVQKTEYSNPTDCKAAANSGNHGHTIPGHLPGTLANPNDTIFETPRSHRPKLFLQQGLTAQ